MSALVRAAAIAALAVCGVACDRTPRSTPGVDAVSWARPLVMARDTAMLGALRLGARGLPSFAAVPRAPLALPPGACAGTVVFARRTAREWYAAWWALPPHSAAILVLSQSVDGGRTWSVPALTNAPRAPSGGCAQTPPALVSAGGVLYVGVAIARGDPAGVLLLRYVVRDAAWEAPTWVARGARAREVSVAADRAVVGVAFERRGERGVDVWLSGIRGGHFERVALPAGARNGRTPALAVHGRRVALAWLAGEARRPVTMLWWGALR